MSEENTKTITVIDRRYAKAMFALIDSNKSEKVDVWEKSLRAAVEVFTTGTIGRYLRSPVNSVAKKEKVIEETLAHVGTVIHPNGRNFLKLLVRNSRFSNLESIFEAFLAEQGRRAGHLRVTVSSAYPLSDEERNKIQNLALEKMNQSSEFSKFTSASIEETLDPNLLAGFLVEFENRRLDLSLKGKMKRLMNAVHT